MLEQLKAQPADALLALIKLYAADERAEKIDLGVGVYRTADGATPVFAAIKAAEARLLADQNSKSYLGPEGDMGFVRAIMPWMLGDFDPAGRIDGLQTPGGTGAVRLAADLLLKAGVRRIWMGTPSWPNHVQILNAVGLACETFRHMDVATQRLDFNALEAALDKAEAGDAVLLHGCCHNPTGADYSETQWDEIAETVAAKRLFPLIDLAYHGLGHGFEADGYGLRAVLSRVPEALIAYSCDKNFGLYRERVGALYVMTESPAQQASVQSNLAALARANWSMPPDHGAASVRIVLEDEGLTKIWLDELASMRARMRGVRDALAAHQAIGSVNLAAVGQQNGLFSVLQLTSEQIAALRADYAVYMAGSGRINIAGFTDANIPHFIEGLRAVTA
ncbi:amino acid aminotransferase [Blastomonas sp.]|uniref:amino acid aminotransferase n=2 Tax=Blastomonas TaxID=150203 RepID=UPI002587EEBB|nr:amino acid aminotransferase [Blastomonas sp.]